MNLQDITKTYDFTGKTFVVTGIVIPVDGGFSSFSRV